MKIPVILSVLALVLVSCGIEVSEPTTVATTAGSPVTSTTTTQPTTTTRAPDTTTSTAQEPDIVISGGTADDPAISIEGHDLFSFALGDEVSIRIQSSVPGELHVHGYNIFIDLVAGETTDVEFLAGIPGIFEAELEDTHTLVFEVEVTP